jgi:hypothetical protein
MSDEPFYTELALKLHASQFQTNFINILKIYLKVKYCEVNKESNLHTEEGIYTQLILQIRYKYANIALTAWILVKRIIR